MRGRTLIISAVHRRRAAASPIGEIPRFIGIGTTRALGYAARKASNAAVGEQTSQTVNPALSSCRTYSGKNFSRVTGTVAATMTIWHFAPTSCGVHNVVA
jgi:hypothetical protein